METRKQFDAIYATILWNIKPYFIYFMKFNEGLNNPYHNLNHTLTLMQLIFDAYRHWTSSNEHYDIKGLILAALFHDFNHLGNKMPDSYNITRAIQGLKDADKWVLENYGKYYKVPTSVRKRAINYIKATQYPYIIKDEDLNKNQALIRDCDILCYFNQDWFTQVLCGLMKELEIEDYKEALNKMEDFLNDAYVLSRTEYSNWVFHNNLKKWKEQKEYYVKNIFD